MSDAATVVTAPKTASSEPSSRFRSAFIRLFFLLMAGFAVFFVFRNRPRQVKSWQDCNLSCIQMGPGDKDTYDILRLSANEVLANNNLPAVDDIPVDSPLLPRVFVDDFTALQLAVDRQLAEDGTQRYPQGLAIRNRSKFQDETFSVEKDKFREKMAVSLFGYVVGTPHAVSRQNETCNLIGPEDTNWWINIADQPTDSEFESVLTVMTPLARENRTWNLRTLRWVADRRWMVRVTGQLVYDNKHYVNNDPGHDLEGQPRRTSLWEIHPIIAFDVCANDQPQMCRDDQNRDHWRKLEDVIVPW